MLIILQFLTVISARSRPGRTAHIKQSGVRTFFAPLILYCTGSQFPRNIPQIIRIFIDFYILDICLFLQDLEVGVIRKITYFIWFPNYHSNCGFVHIFH